MLTTLPGGRGRRRLRTNAGRATRLAACVNLLRANGVGLPVGRGRERDAERQLIIKTTRARVDALWQRVRELHPYEVPEFLVLPIVDGSDAYLRWLGESTS